MRARIEVAEHRVAARAEDFPVAHDDGRYRPVPRPPRGPRRLERHRHVAFMLVHARPRVIPWVLLPADLLAAVHRILEMVEARHVQGRVAVTEDTGILASVRVEGEQLVAGHADLMLPEQERIDRSLRAGYGFVQRLELADMQHLGGFLFYDFNE